MHLSSSKVCDAEYRSAKRSVRPPASQKSASRSVTAPRAVKAQGGTRNRLVWVQVGLFLEDRVVCP